MIQLQLSPELLISVAGILLSAGFTYIPGLNTKFAALESAEKQLVMLGLLVMGSIVLFFAGCFNLLVIESFACVPADVKLFIGMLVSAIISNQSADRILPKPKAVLAVKESKRLAALPEPRPTRPHYTP